MNDHQQLEAIRAALCGALDTDDPDERDRNLDLIRSYAEIALTPEAPRPKIRHLRLVTPAFGALAAGLAAGTRQVRHHAAASAATGLIVAGATTGVVLSIEAPMTMPGAQPGPALTAGPLLQPSLDPQLGLSSAPTPAPTPSSTPSRPAASTSPAPTTPVLTTATISEPPSGVPGLPVTRGHLPHIPHLRAPKTPPGQAKTPTSHHTLRPDVLVLAEIDLGLPQLDVG